MSSDFKEKSSAQIDEIKTLRVSFNKSGGPLDRKSGYVLRGFFASSTISPLLQNYYKTRLFRILANVSIDILWQMPMVTLGQNTFVKNVCFYDMVGWRRQSPRGNQSCRLSGKYCSPRRPPLHRRVRKLLQGKRRAWSSSEIMVLKHTYIF